MRWKAYNRYVERFERYEEILNDGIIGRQVKKQISILLVGEPRRQHVVLLVPSTPPPPLFVGRYPPAPRRQSWEVVVLDLVLVRVLTTASPCWPAQAILDRGYGKPTTHLTRTPGINLGKVPVPQQPLFH